MPTIREWLASIGMSEYAELFSANRIDTAVLPDLTDDDLEKLGVVLGDRRKILRAIRELSEAETARSPTVTEPRLRESAERRQLSAMFIDLVGSTELSAKLDPEDLGELIGVFQKACATAVSEFGGSIAKYIGDGTLAYFGYPEAHEDDAERAVRAGLALVDAIAAMELPLALRLQVRVGIATGLTGCEVYRPRASAGEVVAVGELLNLASKGSGRSVAKFGCGRGIDLQSRRDPFHYEDLGLHELKGIGGGPYGLRRSFARGQAWGRFQARLVKGLTSLVGPGEEIGFMLRRWDYVREGDGQIVLLWRRWDSENRALRRRSAGTRRAAEPYAWSISDRRFSCGQPITSRHQAPRTGWWYSQDLQRGQKVRDKLDKCLLEGAVN